MAIYYGKFDSVRSQRKRRSKSAIPVLLLTVTDVITSGRVVDHWVNVPRPHDAWKLGRIVRGTWLQWEAGSLANVPQDLRRVPENLINRLDEIATSAPDWLPADGEKPMGIMDMFCKDYAPRFIPNEPAPPEGMQVLDMFCGKETPLEYR